MITIKILITFIKNIAIFGVVFIIVLLSFIAISFAYWINSPIMSYANIYIANASLETCQLRYIFNNSDANTYKFQAKDDLKSAYVVLTKDKKIILVESI